MEIRIFKPPESPGGSFVPMSVTDICEKIVLEENFYMPGSFSVTIPHGLEGSDTFQAGYLLVIEERFAGQIEAVTLTAGEAGRVRLVTGADVLGLSSPILCIPPDYTGQSGVVGTRLLQGPTETIFKDLWRDNIVSPPQNWRTPVYGVVLAPDLQRGFPHDEYGVAPDITVSNVTRLLGERARLGLVYRPEFVQNRIVVDVYEGIDRTVRQSANDPVVFSFDRRTLQSVTRDISVKAYRNAFFAAASGAKLEEGAVLAASPTVSDGWNRREQYLSVDVENPEDVSALLTQIDGERVDYAAADIVTIDIEPGQYVYNQDFFLGDYCTIQDDEFDIDMDLQIVSVTTTADANGITYTIGAGIKAQTATGVLRRMIQNGR